MKNTQAIYLFGEGIKQDSYDGNLLGGKGAKLAEMGALGLPVPPGVTISTEQCNSYFNIPEEDRAEFIESLVDDTMNMYEGIAKEFGYMPLVSVRSGARVSMPGMMDTVLNVGLTNETYPEWAERLGNIAADDCYRRLIEMYSEVVLHIPKEVYEECNVPGDYLETFNMLTGTAFPDSIEEQLRDCIEAVFNSWFSDRAIAYRAMHGYPDDWGTAVNVQAMVFGNAGDTSCSGVLFSRDFNTGEPKMVIDWLPNAQGEDVVAGTHTPKTGDELYDWNGEIYSKLTNIALLMDEHYADMQDMEFTVENGKLYILQTRNGKRAALAAFRIAYDLEADGKIDKAEALARVSGKEFVALTAPTIDPGYSVNADVEGIPASGNIVSGVAVLSAADAVTCKEACILVADETTPEDFSGMAAAVGVLTRTGGITSHAAVVARGMNKTCVVGAENLKFEGLAGKTVTLDGKTGRIWVDKDVPIIEGVIPPFVEEMLDWADTETDEMIATAPESVSKGDTAYVDVSDRLGTQTSLSKALDALKGGNGIISFGNNEAMAESDATFLGFFGVESAETHPGDYMIIDKVLHMGKWTKAFKKAWAIHLPNDATVDFANMLRKAGWSVVSRINGFKAALSADGYVVLEQKFLDQLTREGMDFSDIEHFINKAGGELKELPERTTKLRILFDALGG